MHHSASIILDSGKFTFPHSGSITPLLMGTPMQFLQYTNKKNKKIKNIPIHSYNSSLIFHSIDTYGRVTTKIYPSTRHYSYPIPTSPPIPSSSPPISISFLPPKLIISHLLPFANSITLTKSSHLAPSPNFSAPIVTQTARAHLALPQLRPRNADLADRSVPICGKKTHSPERNISTRG